MQSHSFMNLISIPWLSLLFLVTMCISSATTNTNINAASVKGSTCVVNSNITVSLLSGSLSKPVQLNAFNPYGTYTHDTSPIQHRHLDHMNYLYICIYVYTDTNTCVHYSIYIYISLSLSVSLLVCLCVSLRVRVCVGMVVVPENSGVWQKNDLLIS